MDTILFRIPDKKGLLAKSCTNVQLWHQELESEINSDPNHPNPWLSNHTSSKKQAGDMSKADNSFLFPVYLGLVRTRNK